MYFKFNKLNHCYGTSGVIDLDYQVTAAKCPWALIDYVKVSTRS